MRAFDGSDWVLPGDFLLIAEVSRVKQVQQLCSSLTEKNPMRARESSREISSGLVAILLHK
jgi:hypothetical protein